MLARAADFFLYHVASFFVFSNIFLQKSVFGGKHFHFPLTIERKTVKMSSQSQNTHFSSLRRGAAVSLEKWKELKKEINCFRIVCGGKTQADMEGTKYSRQKMGNFLWKDLLWAPRVCFPFFNFFHEVQLRTSQKHHWQKKKKSRVAFTGLKNWEGKVFVRIYMCKNGRECVCGGDVSQRLLKGILL